ncbi:hypothetical protein Tco_0761433 [Tanacetum coccineum]
MMTWNNLMNILRRHGLKWQVAMIRWNKEVSKDWEKANNYDAKEPVGFLIKPKFECLIIFLPSKTGHFARECKTKGNQDSRRRDAWNSGNKDGRRSGKQEDSKALVTIDGEGVDWTSHSEEEEDYALMACNSSGSNTTVLTRTGKIPVNTARASGTKNVSTARHSFNRQAVLTSAAMKVNTVKPIVNRDYPHRALQNKGIVDSGCSRHMTGNKAYLAEYQDFNGGPVAFGGSKGYITGKGKIKTGKLDFEDVCFVKELQHFNLFSVSQMCDKKNKTTLASLMGNNEGFLVGYSLQSKAFRVYNLENKRVEENLHITFLENKPNVARKGPTWLFDLDYLTDSLNYQPVRSENRVNKHAGPPEANQNAGTEDIIDAGDSETEDKYAQDYFVLPIWSSYSSTIKRSRAEDAGVAPHKHLYLKTDEKLVDKEDQVFLDELERLKREEKDANERLKINLNYHNMVAYLEKTEGNAEFHEIIDFLTRSSIHHALTVSPVVSTTFVEQFWTSAKSKIINNVRHITAKVAGKPVSISEASIRSDLLFNDADGIDSLPNQAIFDAIQLMGHLDAKKKFVMYPLFHSIRFSITAREDPVPLDHFPVNALTTTVDPQSDPSPRPSPSTTIPDSIPESSGGNHGGQSSSDKSLSGNEGDMTLQSVYDLCISLCTQVSDQAKEIQHLKAQIKKLKKQAKPVITHHRAWMKSVSLKQRLAGKRSLKKNWMQKEYVSKQGRKSAKAEPSVHKDPLFDEIPEDTLDYMETEDAQDLGRTRDVVDEEKENAEDVLSTAQQKVSTDKEKVSTDRPIVSTDGSKVSTDKEKDSTDRTDEGTDDQTEGGRATQTTQTPTSTIFGDDETIAQVLLNMSQAKAVSREKEKGVEFKDIEETERPRPTSTRSLLTLKPLPKIDPKDKGKKKIEEEDESESESDGIPEAEKKFKQLASDEEMARKVQEEWEGEEERKRLAEEEATNEALIRNYDDIKARIEADRLLAEKLQEEEREQFTIEERAKFLHDTIAAQRKFLAQQRSEAIRNRPPTKNQLRNQMIAYLKHVGNFKHVDLKTKKFEEIQALYEKIKRQDLFHLYDLMREHYSKVTLDGFALILWGDLKIMMESSTEGNEQSDFWSNQQDWKIVTLRLYESCGVCILEFEDGIVIHMAFNSPYFMVKSCMGNEALLVQKANELTIPEQTDTGKGTSNPFMAGSLPKTTKPT